VCHERCSWVMPGQRHAASSFGYDEPGEVHYMEGAGEVTNRERRFLGWFAFTFRLPDGRKPSELAAAAIIKEGELSAVVESIRQSRHVLAMVAMVNPGRGLILKLEDEEFIVNNRQLSYLFSRGDAIYAHIIPAGRYGWLVGPGWLQWPIRIMPGMQAMLKKFQLDPIELERFLQQRIDLANDRPKPEMPRDSSLQAAVARMTEAAKAEGRLKLIMTPAEWKKLVFAGNVPKVVEKRISISYPIEKQNKKEGGYTDEERIPQRAGIDHARAGVIAGGAGWSAAGAIRS
jgi:hypothetical protein